MTDTTTSIVFNTTLQSHTRVKGRSVGKRVTHCESGESKKTSRNEFLVKNTLSWLFYLCIFNADFFFFFFFFIKEFRIREYRVYWDSFIQAWVSERAHNRFLDTTCVELTGTNTRWRPSFLLKGQTAMYVPCMRLSSRPLAFLDRTNARRIFSSNIKTSLPLSSSNHLRRNIQAWQSRVERIASCCRTSSPFLTRIQNEIHRYYNSLKFINYRYNFLLNRSISYSPLKSKKNRLSFPIIVPLLICYK